MIFDIKHEELYKDLEDWLRGIALLEIVVSVLLAFATTEESVAVVSLFETTPQRHLKY